MVTKKRFDQIKVGEVFTFDGQWWVKIVTKNGFGAMNVDSFSVTSPFQDNFMVIPQVDYGVELVQR